MTTTRPTSTRCIRSTRSTSTRPGAALLTAAALTALVAGCSTPTPAPADAAMKRMNTARIAAARVDPMGLR